jgi:Na+/proline symporter
VLKLLVSWINFIEENLEMENLSIYLMAYFAIMTAGCYFIGRNYSHSKESFLLADRNAGLLESSLAAGFGWLAGLALFASSGFAYNIGWVGLLYFVAPQILGMWTFAWFSNVCNRTIPDGYTISSYMRERYGRTVSTVYQICFVAVSIGFVSLSFTALNIFFKFINAPDPALLTGILAAGTVLYSITGGFKVNLISASMQMVMALIICGALLYVGIGNEAGWATLMAGVNGKRAVTDPFDWQLLQSTVLALSLTLYTGVVMSQGYYQKSFGQQRNPDAWKSFVVGPLLFAVVPVTLGIIGMLAMGSGMAIKDPQTAHLAWLQQNLGTWALLAFGLLTVNVAASTIDGHGNAIGSIAAHDWTRDERNSVWVSRAAIAAIGLVGYIISTYNIPLTYLTILYAQLRVSLFFITIMGVSTRWLSSRGIVSAVVLTVPAAIYMNMNGMSLYATLLVLFGSPLIALGTSKR